MPQINTILVLLLIINLTYYTETKKNLMSQLKRAIINCTIEENIEREINVDDVDALEVKKLFLCIYNKLGFIKEDGYIDYESFKKLLMREHSKEEAERTAKKCLKEKPEDKLEYVGKVISCLKDESSL